MFDEEEFCTYLKEVSDQPWAEEWEIFFFKIAVECDRTGEPSDMILNFTEEVFKITREMIKASNGLGYKINVSQMQENPSSITKLFAMISLGKLLEEIHYGRVLWDARYGILSHTNGYPITVTNFLTKMRKTA